MYIPDYGVCKATPSLRFSEETPAIVVVDNDETEKDNVLGVFIPKLMFGINFSNGAKTENVKLDGPKCLNSKNSSSNLGSDSITIKNYALLNIATIPNIVTPRFRKGENVVVSFADKDLKSPYILPYSFGDINRRKTDVVSLIAPNFKEEKETPDISNTYGIQIDTVEQIVSIWTSKVNGEKGQYSFSIYPKKGKILISDSGKRTFTIDTDNDSIEMKNEGGCSITMKGDTIDIKSKTLNIDMTNMNIKGDELKRDVDNIKTESTSDEENVTTLKIKGTTLESDYTNTKISGTSYESKYTTWKTDSPVAGFTKTLTANSFSIYPMAGSNPLPTAPNINQSGIAAFGNPSVASLPVALAVPTVQCLTTLAAVIDTILSAICVPPTMMATIGAMTPSITSKCIKG